MEEKLLNEENWKYEAEAVINDVKEHVSNIEISKALKPTNAHIYINLTTIEKENYCIELSAEGFRVVGREYNMKDISSDNYFETPYGLLNHISPRYNDSFGNALLNKLNALRKDE